MDLTRGATLSIALLLLCTTASSCGQRDRASERLAEDSAAAQQSTEDLTLANITLQQSDNKGQTLWQVKAEQATYSPDRKTATVTYPNGVLYQDGKPVFRVKSDQGQVEQNGELIRLSGKIVAIDLRSGTVVKGDELDWRPQQDTLVVRNHLVGTHRQLQAMATEARIYSRKHQMEFLGNVVVVTRDPDLRLQGQHFTWLMDQQKVVSDRPAQVQQLAGRQVTGQAQSEQALVDLKAKTIALKQNGQLLLQDPPLQINSNNLFWRLKDQIVNANQPVTVRQHQQNITVTADRGQMDLRQQLVNLTQNVQAAGQRNRSQLSSDRLSWNMKTQDILAQGNVVYTQVNPVTTVKAPRATGKFQGQTIVLGGGRVETEIVPGRDIGS
jgi:LPS export ABC transporter protein LptC